MVKRGSSGPFSTTLFHSCVLHQCLQKQTHTDAHVQHCTPWNRNNLTPVLGCRLSAERRSEMQRQVSEPCQKNPAGRIEAARQLVGSRLQATSHTQKKTNVRTSSPKFRQLLILHLYMLFWGLYACVMPVRGLTHFMK